MSIISLIKKIAHLKDKREIHRIYIANTLRSIFLSMVTVYVPIFLLTKGYTLSQVIYFFGTLQITGLVVALFIITPIMRKWGLVQTVRLYYPIEIVYYILLYLLQDHAIPYLLIAAIGGVSTFMYYVPLNILLIKHADYDKMGSDIAVFFSLPQVFRIIGPLIAAFLIPLVGFWIVFMIAMVGLAISYLPLIGINTHEVAVTLRLAQMWQKFKERKTLFFLEALDNIIEESEWFWSLYVYLIIGTLYAAGFVGSLQAIGGALFTLLIGKYASKHTKPLIIGSALLLVFISALRIFITNHLFVYTISLVTSFVMTAYLISYFSFIYKTVKGKEDESFIILREIPTVVGRMVVFGAILLLTSHTNIFFILPILTIMVLLVVFYKIRKTG